MVLKNYWWLLIWLLLFGGISFLFIPKREEIVLGKPCMRWGRLPAFVLVLPFVLWAGWRRNIGDTEVYRASFQDVPIGLDKIGAFLQSQSKDRGFALLESLYKSLVSDSDVGFFLLIAAIQIFFLIIIYRKYSENCWLSFFLFVASTDYLSWMHNGMRQFLAVTIIFGALPLLIRKRYLLMIAVVILASQIHLSALLFLPFIFIVNGKAWNIRTILFIFGVLLAVYFVDEVTGYITDSLRDTAYEGDIKILESDDGTNIFRVLFYSVPAILSFVFRERIYAEDDPVINICVNLSVVTAGIYLFSFFTSGILIGRLPIFFSLANYILIPWLIKELVTPESGLLVQGGFMAVYTAFFYYQVFVTWKLM